MERRSVVVALAAAAALQSVNTAAFGQPIPPGGYQPGPDSPPPPPPDDDTDPGTFYGPPREFVRHEATVRAPTVRAQRGHGRR